MITFLICLGIWLSGAALTFLLSPYLDSPEVLERQKPNEEFPPALYLLWPLAFFLLPFAGLSKAHNAIKKRRIAKYHRRQKELQEKVRVETSLQPIIQEIEKELDYRHMPCIACGHTVEKEPHEREARSSTL